MEALVAAGGVYALVIVGVQVIVVVGAICAMAAASRSGAILRRVTELEERVRQLGRTESQGREQHAKTCPRCGKTSPGSALQCDCGHRWPASDPHASRPMSALEQLEAQAEANRRAAEERKLAKGK